MGADLQQEPPWTVTAPSPGPDPRLEKISLGEPPTVLPGPPEVWKTGGRLLSGVLALNVVLLGCALVSSGAFHEVVLAERELLSFLCVLMGISGCWMVTYLLWTSRHPDNGTIRDTHAGPIWLRGGLALFGVCTLVLDVFKIGESLTLENCESPLKIIYSVIQSVFVVIQTYFLWISCKDCVQIHLNLTRCGIMLTLSTNLAIWMAAVTDESLHQTVELEETAPSGDNNTCNGGKGVRAGGGSSGCECVSNLCQIFRTGYYYLYPFNIEYSLFASAMAYVMWKNVGRVMASHLHQAQHTFRARSLFVGLVCGTGVLVAGLGVFIVYEVEMNTTEGNQPQALFMFYIFNIVALGLMSVASLTGSIVYRFDKRDINSHKNPTRTLDVALLLGAALGQYWIAYYSIVAMVATSPLELLNALNLVYSLLLIVQHTLQNTFIIEGLHREPFQDGPLEHRSSGGFHDRNLFRDVYVNPASATTHGSHSRADHEQELDIGRRGTLTHSLVRDTRANWRRKLLREISQFLLLCNIIFWIIPAFGARPQFDNPLELQFYGYPMWVAIVNIGLPFGIFYRMHAVASLLEVYLMT